MALERKTQNMIIAPLALAAWLAGSAITGFIFGSATAAQPQTVMQMEYGHHHHHHGPWGYPGWGFVTPEEGYGGEVADCRSLRYACTHKEELGQEGMGNCRRYRELCSR